MLQPEGSRLADFLMMVPAFTGKGCEVPEFKENIFYNQLPSSVKNVLDKIVRDLQPSRIVLFGSRARGDNRPNSDFDICIFGGDSHENRRAALRTSIDEEPISLHSIDILFSDELNDNYLINVQKEGKELYA